MDNPVAFKMIFFFTGPSRNLNVMKEGRVVNETVYDLYPHSDKFDKGCDQRRTSDI